MEKAYKPEFVGEFYEKENSVIFVYNVCVYRFVCTVDDGIR